MTIMNNKVLFVVTLDKWLHLFPLDSKCEKFHETAAFNSFVMDGKREKERDIFTPIDPLMVQKCNVFMFIYMYVYYYVTVLFL